jgi:hypothetical protein
MSNFLKLTSEIENRLGHYATRLFRIEAHLRQGEIRAARKRLEGFDRELEQFERDLEFPFETTLIGAQLGFFSGKGSLLRGRLPGAAIGAMAGWLYGQSTVCEYRDALEQLKLRVHALRDTLLEPDASDEAESDVPSDADESSDED